MAYMANKKIISLDELHTAMWLEEHEDNIPERFSEVADFLMNRCAIKHNNKVFRIIDLECYFYNKCHRDITAHPRKSDAVCWYINDFGGIDLNFKSSIEKEGNKIAGKYVLNDDSYFGGILIRQVQEWPEGERLDGPLKVADLFRIQRHDVIPTLEEIEFGCIKPYACERLNLLGSSKDSKKKTEYNVSSCFANDGKIDKEELEEKLKGFCNAKYRFTLSEDIKPKSKPYVFKD